MIEDDPLMAVDLERCVEDLGHRVINVARTAAQAVASAKASRPDLILSDVQLADGSSGIDAVNEICNEIDVPVIFVTSYPDRFLTGTRPEPTFLIPKPFHPETVKAIVAQALSFAQTSKSTR